MPKLVVAFFYAGSGLVLAVSRPETACMALPARPAYSMRWRLRH